MSEPLSERLQRQLARVAQQIQQTETESDSQRRRLESADDDTLRRVLYDRSEPRAARAHALMFLLSRYRRELALTEILLPLWDDPDEEIARQAIEYVPPFDPRVTERLRALLDDPKTHRWIAAASTLAR